MLLNTPNLRLLKRREKRNADRPELQALLAKYECDHATLTMATARAKDIVPGRMFINSLGMFQATQPATPEKHTHSPRNGMISEWDSSIRKDGEYEFGDIELTAEDWHILAHAALHDRDSMPILFAEIISTATH